MVSGLTVYSVIYLNISVLRYNPLYPSSYIKLAKELDHPRKRLINIQNTDDNQCFNWCLVRYLNLTNHHTARIPKTGKNFANRLNFKGIKFEKMNSIGISVIGHKNQEKHSIYVPNQCCEKNMLIYYDRTRKEKSLCSYQRF